MTLDGTDRSSAAESGAAEQTLPTFSQQLADQLGGLRGVLEASVPVAVFIIVNIITSLNIALIVSCASAVALAAYRLARRETVRNAVNGLFGIGIGAIIAWRTGSSKDFYLPGIILSGCYGVAMLISVPLRLPLIGWAWSLISAGGRTEWRHKPTMVRLFSWLTVLWAIVYLLKVGIQAIVFQHTSDNDPGTALGIARLLLGYPPYVALLAFTAWAVRRHTSRMPAAEREAITGKA